MNFLNDTTYTNSKGESILVKRLTTETEINGYTYTDGAFCDVFDSNGQFKERGWFFIHAIENFINR